MFQVIFKKKLLTVLIIDKLNKNNDFAINNF